MDGVHDMRGMDGFGKVEVEKNEPGLHASWEGRVRKFTTLTSTPSDGATAWITAN